MLQHMKKLYILIAVVGMTVFAGGSAFALTIFTWGGAPITGEAGVEYPTFFPEGKAVFDITSPGTLTLNLTYTGSSEMMLSINEALTALTWDLEGFGGSLTADSAWVASGSSLVGANLLTWDALAGDPNDLSGQWAYKDNIVAADLGSYGVGTMGDILFGTDTFGNFDIIDPSKTWITPAPGGADFAIVGSDIDLTHDGYASQGPMVQSSMVFTFNFTGDLSESMITNVNPLFGTEGAPVPEPGTLSLMGIGLVGLAFWRNRQGKIKV